MSDTHTSAPSHRPGMGSMPYEDGGYWYADVPGVKPGDEYKYVITAADGAHLWRTDPYAPPMTGSNGDLSADGPGRDDLPCSGTVGLGPYSALVLSQEA
ncbi:Carbohydrate-binding module 48 (Isoamylase N-terminal domain) [Streptomyces sp. cf386]|uniref:hypothetical protein n=1 Tax=Streptomyces sp. cf386 TaxID=1761904 RepID=UPI00088A9875|nr:hypothetical protein [Streptomyces sp. cf386]SDP41525.1 Carbohydrate-binding module 48 (Isoamylase N-terminal domain) [Streptomyces sp. cf386]